MHRPQPSDPHRSSPVVKHVHTTNNKYVYTEKYFRRVEHRPKMWAYSVIPEYPIVLFADAILAEQCVTLTSRYHGDGRPEYDLELLDIQFRLFEKDSKNFPLIAVSGGPRVFKSNARGFDTPVLQLRYCDSRYVCISV